MGLRDIFFKFRLESYHNDLINLILENNENRYVSTSKYNRNSSLMLHQISNNTNSQSSNGNDIENEDDNFPMPSGILENLIVDYPDTSSATQLDYYTANKSEVIFKIKYF